MADRRPTSDLLTHRPFPELAAALRSTIPRIIEVWADEVCRVVPRACDLPFEELTDNLPTILPAIADALDAADPAKMGTLRARSPAQGLTRFRQNYDVQELMLEDRLLRQVTIEQTQAAMDRRMTLEEQMALAMAIDEMLQQAVVAFMTEQNAQLRTAAEVELKYLSFLSHDLNNNLSSVTLLLQLLRQRLATSATFATDVQTLDAAQQAILDTIGGMGRLLASERLRKGGVQPERRPVALHGLAENAARQSAKVAEGKGVGIVVDVPSDCVVVSDGELIALVLNNLVGNAVKYSTDGTVRIRAARQAGEGGGGCVVSVSDEGPGIAAEHLDHLFDAFRRAEGYGQPGVGLGLTIAAQAAKLLGGALTVESKVGRGSTFALTLPA